MEGAVDAVVTVITELCGAGLLLPANCCWTAAMSLGSNPVSRMPDPGASSCAKIGAVAGRVAGGLAVDEIGSWTISVVGCVADST